MTVTGRVLAPEGKPVSEADVAAIAYRPGVIPAEEPKVLGPSSPG
jgi:hypothetical protein